MTVVSKVKAPSKNPKGKPTPFRFKPSSTPLESAQEPAADASTLDPPKVVATAAPVAGDKLLNLWLRTFGSNKR